MPKNDEAVRVHKRFYDNLKAIQSSMETDLGYKPSFYEITGIMSHNLPIIKLEIDKKKKANLFDF